MNSFYKKLIVSSILIGSFNTIYASNDLLQPIRNTIGNDSSSIQTEKLVTLKINCAGGPKFFDIQESNIQHYPILQDFINICDISFQDNLREEKRVNHYMTKLEQLTDNISSFLKNTQSSELHKQQLQEIFSLIFDYCLKRLFTNVELETAAAFSIFYGKQLFNQDEEQAKQMVKDALAIAMEQHNSDNYQAFLKKTSNLNEVIIDMFHYGENESQSFKKKKKRKVKLICHSKNNHNNNIKSEPVAIDDIKNDIIPRPLLAKNEENKKSLIGKTNKQASLTKKKRRRTNNNK